MLSGPNRFRQRSLAVMLACATAAAAVAGTTAAGASPEAHIARQCTPAPYPGLGYFTSLVVRGTDCRAGNKLIVAYYHCRTHSGASGRCHGNVLGYSCHEGKRMSSSVEIDARVTCHRRQATVVHTYQQDI